MNTLLASIFEPKTAGSTRLRSLEGLRGFAIVLVFICHYYDIIWRNLPQSDWFSHFGFSLMGAGGTGVDLFFVLSGYLIYAYWRKPNVSYCMFMLRRCRRIYPTFLAVVLLYLCIITAVKLSGFNILTEYRRVPEHLGSAVGYIVANILFLPGIFPIEPLMKVAWSLSYEWCLYLSLPLLVISTRCNAWPRSVRITFFTLLALGFLLSTFLFPEVFYSSFTSARTSHIRAVMFIGGIVVYETRESHILGNKPGRLLDWLSSLFLVAALAISGGYAASQVHPSRVTPLQPRVEAALVAPLLVGYSCLLLVTLIPSTVLNRTFSARPLRWLGNISYSFYLLHPLPLHLVGSLTKMLYSAQSPGKCVLLFLGLLPLVFVFTVGLSALLYVLIERRLSFPAARSVQEISSYASPRQTIVKGARA
jgi:exopolysaccharide production protein ExoZ